MPEPVPEPEPAPPAPPAGCVCGIPPPAPSHASASCMESRGVAYPLGAAIACGDSCTFTCADGFADPVANGATSKDFQCTTLTALFTDHALECQAVPEPEPEPAPSPGCVCGIPPAAPAHAAVTCLKSDGAAYPLGAAVACGDLCTVACNDHFADPVANGATRKDFQCAGAQFTDHTLDCQAVPEPEPEPCECGAAPPRPQHAQTTCWQAEIRCGESCTFTCDNHFTDPDKGTSTTFSCAVDGVFTDHSLNCQLEPEPEPLPEPEPEDKLCDEAYKAAFASTMSPQGVCQGPAACMPDHPNTPCQKLITNMLQRCKDVVYNETVDGRTVSRSFDQQAVLALKQLGPATCDYHEGYEACEATCTMAHATQALGDGCGKWFFSTLWQGFCRPDGSDSDFSACKDAGPEGGCSAACMTRFYDYQDKCAGCQDPLVQDFLSKAAGGALKTPSASCLYNHLPCMGAATCMTGCDNVTERVLRTCCSGESTECDGNCIGVPKKKCNAPDNGCRWLDDPKKSGAARCIAEDPFPSTCASDGGCQEAVVAAALEVCPKIFYEQPRMFGLYTDCTEGRPETVSDLEEAYMREVPDMPIVPPPPPAHPFVPHYNEDTGRVRVPPSLLCHTLPARSQKKAPLAALMLTHVGWLCARSGRYRTRSWLC